MFFCDHISCCLVTINQFESMSYNPDKDKVLHFSMFGNWMGFCHNDAHICNVASWEFKLQDKCFWHVCFSLFRKVGVHWCLIDGSDETRLILRFCHRAELLHSGAFCLLLKCGKCFSWPSSVPFQRDTHPQRHFQVHLRDSAAGCWIP